MSEQLPKKKLRQKFRRILPIGIAGGITLLCFILISYAGTWLVKKDKLVHADAIVILMGSISDRVLQAADLYSQGYASTVIMVEESMGAYRLLKDRGVEIISSTTQCKNALMILGVPETDIITLPGDAVSTQMEAGIITNYLKRNLNIDTILLVTSPDHTRRASMIFTKAFQKSKMHVSVISCPSLYNDFTGRAWWRKKEDIQTVVAEYVKLLNFLLLEQYRL